MTYQSHESSLDDGLPVELYQFARGSETPWRFTSAPEVIEHLGNTFDPSSIQRTGEVKQTEQIAKNGASFKFPITGDFAVAFLAARPELVTTVTVWRMHLTDVDQEFAVYWKGRVRGRKISGDSLTLECEHAFTTLKNNGVNPAYSRTCRHTIYTPYGCKVDQNLYKHSGTVSAIASEKANGPLTIIDVTGVDGQLDGHYTGGFIVHPSGAQLFVTSHVGIQLKIIRPLADMAIGDAVDVYPGCDRLRTTCNDKFNNLANFGGCPFTPSRNAFEHDVRS